MPGEAPFREPAGQPAAALPAVPPPPRPFWQRLLAPFVGLPTKGQWAWFRAHYGGRWARLWRRVEQGTPPHESLGWHHLPDCPCVLYEHNQRVYYECRPGACKCEVYP